MFVEGVWRPELWEYTHNQSEVADEFKELLNKLQVLNICENQLPRALISAPSSPNSLHQKMQVLGAGSTVVVKILIAYNPMNSLHV